MRQVLITRAITGLTACLMPLGIGNWVLDMALTIWIDWSIINDQLWRWGIILNLVAMKDLFIAYGL